MKLFYVIHAVEGDRVVQYQGMTADTIEAMLKEQNLSFDPMREEEYDAFLIAHKPAPLPVADFTQEKAILSDKQAIANQRIDALIKILGL